MIIKGDDLEMARMYLDNNRRFKELNRELLKANVASLKANGFKGLVSN